MLVPLDHNYHIKANEVEIFNKAGDTFAGVINDTVENNMKDVQEETKSKPLGADSDQVQAPRNELKSENSLPQARGMF